MSTCGKIFNQDFKQVTTPYQDTLVYELAQLVYVSALITIIVII
ncbi:hypothetical protein FWK35_00036654 [Aphis craccivora]|uniref:Uncharacterized protein n=1 Tax=Aphis craccivora TaxID=307492 RepID=A0A6G0VKK0_APHCR|nr:hypothetical protein FWK35_00036654 [Aphis craccivora]